MILFLPSLLGREYQKKKGGNYESKYSSMQNLHLPDIQILTVHQLNNFCILKEAAELSLNVCRVLAQLYKSKKILFRGAWLAQ